MKPGLDHRRIHPHQDAAVIIQGLIVCENALKHTRSRNGCMGTCMMLSAGEPQRRTSVPWMSECRKRSSERRRNADFESVESVRGRKMRI